MTQVSFFDCKNKYQLTKINEHLFPVERADEITAGLGCEFDNIKVAKSPKSISQDSIDAYAQSGVDFKVKAIDNADGEGHSLRYTPLVKRDLADDDRAFRHKIFSRHANIAVMLANGYKRIEKLSNHVDANKRLRAADSVLTLKDINLSVGDTELCKQADDKSRYCMLKIANKGYEYSTFLELCDYVLSYSLKAPVFDDKPFVVHSVLTPFEIDSALSELEGALNRMADTVWWRRLLRNKQLITIEQLARDFRLVHKKSSAYLSDFSVQAKRQRKADNEELMSKMFVLNEGQSPLADNVQSLQDVIDSSSNSGSQQAAELMVRIRGTEEVAQSLGHACDFHTLTLPSRFHSVLASGYPNKKYQDGLSAKDGQDYFNEIWKLARARFSKQDLKPYGFRVVEPHHDGCPHWHMMLFMPKGQIAQVRKIMKELCMRDTPEEVKTISTRFKAVYINPAKGSAAGYIAKYITKSVNGADIKEVIDPASGEIKIAPADAAERARFWASINNIRQFEAIGLPSVTVWREMRKLGMGLEGKCKVANTLQVDINNLGDYALEKVRQAADSSDWAAFCIAMGGIQVKRKDQAVRIHYQIPDLVDQFTGEVSRSEMASPNFSTKYGDKPRARVAGMTWDAVVLMTRNSRPEIVTEKVLKARQKVMTGVAEQFEEWIDQCVFETPTEEELFFFNECVYEDKANKAFFADAESFDVGFYTDAVSLDLCH